MKYLIIIATLLTSISAYSQKKIDLDDLDIKGDLMGDNRLQMINREKNNLKNYVEYRTNFRKEIVEELTRPYPIYNHEK